MRDCQKCGSPNPDQISTCDHCGAKLEPATILTDAERREAIQAIQRPIPRQSISILAIFALALGLFSPIACVVLYEKRAEMLIPIALAFPIIAGIIARILIGDEGGRLRGIKLANNAIVLSIVLPLLTWIFVIPLLPHRHSEMGGGCTSNQRQLSMALLMYAQENEGMFPGKAGITPSSPDAEKQQWRVTDVQGLATEVFNCKSSPLSGAPGPATAEYAMNTDVMGLELRKIPLPYAVILTADTKGTDALFSARDIARRHNGGFIASFCDGHVTYFPSTVTFSDPKQTPLQTGNNTAADYNAPSAPAVNPFIIQGAANMIKVELKNWNSQPHCTIPRGKKLATYIGTDGYYGTYLSVIYSGLAPEPGTPRDLTIGTFVNGSAADYTAKQPAGAPPYGIQPTKNFLTVPAAGGRNGYYTTFWLPPVIGNDAQSGRRYTHYSISTGPDGVAIAPAY